MKNTISNKELRNLLNDDMVLSECNHSSISIDNKDLNLSASLDLLTLEFACAMYVGENEEQTELTEEQEDTIYYLLLNTQSSDNQFNFNDQDHALTLIYS